MGTQEEGRQEGQVKYDQNWDSQPAWIQTYTGKKFWPLNPKVEDVDIFDIAHALSMTCRYTGHCMRFFSVAEHSVWVAKMVVSLLRTGDPSITEQEENEVGRAALLHDASEAYICDLSRPLKHNSSIGEEYKNIEERLTEIINLRFGLSVPLPEQTVRLIKKVDNLALEREIYWNMRSHDIKTSYTEPLYRSPEEAKNDFVNLFLSLGGKL